MVSAQKKTPGFNQILEQNILGFFGMHATDDSDRLLMLLGFVAIFDN